MFVDLICLTTVISWTRSQWTVVNMLLLLLNSFLMSTGFLNLQVLLSMPRFTIIDYYSLIVHAIVHAWEQSCFLSVISNDIINSKWWKFLYIKSSWLCASVPSTRMCGNLTTNEGKRQKGHVYSVTCNLMPFLTTHLTLRCKKKKLIHWHNISSGNAGGL